MDVSLLLVAALIVLATWYFFLRDSKRAQFVRTVNLLPGPKSYPIVGTFLPIIFAKRSEVVKVVIDIANKYKPLFRTWIGGRFAEINIMEPEHLEVIMSSSKHIEKSFGYEFMKPWIGTGLLTSTGQKWHTHRKMITPTFHFKILESFVEVFAEKSEILVDKLQKEVGSQGFDVYPYITKCALDIICETAMGTPIFAQDNAESEYVKAVYEGFVDTMDALVLVLAGVLFVIACRLFLHRRIRVQFARKVDLIPGPVAYPFVGSIGPLLFKKNNDLFAEFLKIIGQQKPIFRMWFGGQPEVYLTRPEHVEVMLSSTRNLQKGFVYKFLHSWLGTGLLTATGQKWFTHRKMITPTFHFKILDSFVEVFAEKSEILVEKLQKEVRSKGFDVYPYITLCALDIICETAMGTPIFAQDDADSEYVKALYELSEVVVQRIHKPWLHSPLFFNLSQLGKRHKHCLKILHGFTNRVIQERKRESRKSKENSHTVSESEDDVIGNKRRKAFLDLLLETTMDGRTMTDEELREEVDTFMFEGHDTTSAGMCWALYMLGLHPDVQDKAYEEQQRIFQDSGRAPTMKDLSDMKYLEQVIKESLRLYPSVPAFSRLLTEDIQIDNYTIPAGCALKAHIYSLHRNPDQFPNPEKFDPDNFLPERIVKRHPYAYVPFSAGPRNCIGQKFAILEEKTVLSYILRKYKLRSLDQREDIKEVAELILRPENGIRLCITPRDV